MAQAALKEYYADEEQDAFLADPLNSPHLDFDSPEVLAIDTSKIPRVMGTPSPQNKAEFLALLRQSERSVAEGRVHSSEEVFAWLKERRERR